MAQRKNGSGMDVSEEWTSPVPLLRPFRPATVTERPHVCSPIESVVSSGSSGRSRARKVDVAALGVTPEKKWYSIFQPPPPGVIKKAMECEICGNIGRTIRECEGGHLLCGRNFTDQVGEDFIDIVKQDEAASARAHALGQPGVTKNKQPLPECKNEDLESCPAQIIKNGKKVICNEVVFDSVSELYTMLYETSTFGCPAHKEGCDAKMKPKDILSHVKKCSYCIVRACPNTACKQYLRFSDFKKHILDKEEIPRYEGASNLIKVHQDCLKLELSPFQWIAAVIEHEDNTFLLIVRQEDQFVIIWLTQIHSSFSYQKFVNTITVQGQGNDNGETWTGPVHGEQSWPYLANPEDALKLHVVRLMRYKTDVPERQQYQWDVLVELQAVQ